MLFQELFGLLLGGIPCVFELALDEAYDGLRVLDPIEKLVEGLYGFPEGDVAAWSDPLFFHPQITQIAPLALIAQIIVSESLLLAQGLLDFRTRQRRRSDRIDPVWVLQYLPVCARIVARYARGAFSLGLGRGGFCCAHVVEEETP